LKEVSEGLDPIHLGKALQSIYSSPGEKKLKIVAVSSRWEIDECVSPTMPCTLLLEVCFSFMALPPNLV